MGWMTESNRPEHLWAGLMVFTMSLQFFLLLDLPVVKAAAGALFVSAVAAATKEYTDYLHGDVFDWLDLLATVLLPFIVTLILLFIVLWLNYLSWPPGSFRGRAAL